jgi:hypothetical protein
MTVSLTGNRWNYVGNGATTDFAYLGRIFAATDLEVFLDGAAQMTGYSVTNVGNLAGGNVSFAAAPAADVEVTIRRAVPASQEKIVPSTGAFLSAEIEKGLDKLTILVQQLLDDLARSVRLDDGDATAALAAIPLLDARKGRVLAFDPVTGELVASTSLGFWRGTWTAATQYSRNDSVKDPVGGGVYIAVSAFTSGADSATDLADATRWQLALSQPTGIWYEDPFTGNGATTAFGPLTAPPANGKAIVFVDGVKQPASGYTIVGTTITFGSAPANLAEIEVTYVNVTAFALTDGQVTTAKIANDAVTLAKLAPGTPGKRIGFNGAGDPAEIDPGLPRSYLAGFGLANNGVDAVNDIDIAAGAARSDDNSVDIVGAAMTKRLDANWAVGTNQGGLDAGTKANTTGYHLFAILRPDTGVVDVLFSTSATAPTMPANYTKKRRIGWVRTDGGGNIRAFKQRGDLFRWVTPPLDVNAANPGTARVLRTLTVPSGIEVTARLAVDARRGATNSDLVICPPDQTDQSPNRAGGALPTIQAGLGSNGEHYWGGTVIVETNTSAQVATRFVFSDSNVELRIETLAWLDRRGQDD